MSIITAPGWTRAIGVSIIPGGAAGAHSVPGPINAGDDILAVKHLSADLVTIADITAEFTIAGSNALDNALGTVTTGDFILVVWVQANV
jgi:hypothetical protein